MIYIPPLFLAIEKENLEIVKLLLPHTTIDSNSKYKMVMNPIKKSIIKSKCFWKVICLQSFK